MTQNIHSKTQDSENILFTFSNKQLPFKPIFKILDFAGAENKLNSYLYMNEQFSHYTKMYIFHKACAYVNALQTKKGEWRNSSGAEKNNKANEYNKLFDSLKKLLKNPINLAVYLTYHEDKTFNEKLSLLWNEIFNGANYSYFIKVIQLLNNEQATLFIKNRNIDPLKFFNSLNQEEKQILFDRAKDIFPIESLPSWDLKCIYQHLTAEQTEYICSAFLTNYKKRNFTVTPAVIINLLSHLSVEKTSKVIDIFKEDIKAVLTSDFIYYDIVRNIKKENRPQLFDLLNNDLKKKIKSPTAMYNF